MSDEKLFREWADKWVRNELTDDERQQFEAARRADPLLDQQAREHRQIAGAMGVYGRRTEFRKQLNRIHATLDMDEMRTEAGQFQTRPAKIRSLWQTYRSTFAVAASVAVFCTFGTLALYRSYQESSKQQEQYSMLRRDLQAIRRSQNEILQDISARQRALQLNPGQVAGSSFLISPEGYLVTNTHIVRDADSVWVQNAKGEIFKASLVYTDGAYDLAILQVRDDSAFRAKASLPYGFDPRPSDLGERVFTLGFPRDEVVYGEGYLSARTGFRNDTTAYQVAISVNPGNSGGPLLDEKGNVIGIISGKNPSSDGASYAIKTAHLFQAMASIKDDSLKNRLLTANRRSTLTKLSRKEQVKRMQDYVFMVKVFKHEK